MGEVTEGTLPTHPGPGPSPRPIPGADGAGSQGGEPVRRRAGLRRESLDPHAVFVVRRLRQNGHEAYLVGGCVRDLLCGLEPKDFDVATDAHPNRIKRLFRSARVIGRRFRLVHIRFPGDHIVEAATFRAAPGQEVPEEAGADEAAPPGGRSRDWRASPENVFGTASEDARRRDFTINALFYDPLEEEVIDWVGGLADLEDRIVRSIGDPRERIREDPVRMLRAVHFAHRMDCRIEASLAAAIGELSGTIAEASQSRLYVELIKMLGRGRAAPTFRDLHQRGVLRAWLPEFAAVMDTPAEWPADGAQAGEGPSPGEPEDVPVPHATWNLLGAADRYGISAHGGPESLALAALFGPWVRSGFAGRRKRTWPGFQEHFDAVFRPVALRMSIPRWATLQMREALWLLDELRHPPPGERRRRIVRRSAFPVALRLLELDLMARDQPLERVEQWEAEAARARVPTDFAGAVARSREEARGTGRRRGREGHGRGQGEAARPDPDAAAEGRRRGGRRRTRRRLGPLQPEADAWEPPPV